MASMQKMDGLDDLMRDVAMSSTATRRMKHESRKGLSQNSAVAVTQSQEATDIDTREIEKLVKELTAFMIDIADPQIRNEINSKLSSINYSKFEDYYLRNAKLSHYSLERELGRMDFRVLYNGQDTTNKEEIGDIFYETRLDDIWRFANQSIYADLYHGLDEIKQKQTHISIVATASQFTIDITGRSLVADSTYDVVVMCEGLVKERLRLATIQGRVEVQLAHKRLRQHIDPPCMCIVFDEELRKAARCILRTCPDPSNSDTHTSSLVPTLSNATSALLDIVAPRPPAHTPTVPTSPVISSPLPSPRTSSTPSTPVCVQGAAEVRTPINQPGVNPSKAPSSATSTSSNSPYSGKAPSGTCSGEDMDNVEETSTSKHINKTDGSSSSAPPYSPPASNRILTDVTRVSALTESLVVNVVGSVGRWLGATPTAQVGAVDGGGWGDLRRTLQEQKQQQHGVGHGHRKNVSADSGDKGGWCVCSESSVYTKGGVMGTVGDCGALSGGDWEAGGPCGSAAAGVSNDDNGWEDDW